MNVQEFVKQYTGQVLTVTGPDQSQCTAVPHQWEVSLGLPIVYGHAKDTLVNASYLPKSYEVIKNTPTNYPNPGDIVVWNATWGSGYGHTGVVVSADAKKFSSFEQNNPLGSSAKVHNHDYSGVVGWFRPRIANQGNEVMPKLTKEAEIGLIKYILGRSPSAEEVKNAGNRTELQWFQDATKEIVYARNVQNGKINDLIRQSQAQQSAIDSGNKQAKALNDANVELQATVANLQEQLHQLQNQWSVPALIPGTVVLPESPETQSTTSNNPSLPNDHTETSTTVQPLPAVEPVPVKPAIQSLEGQLTAVMNVVAVASLFLNGIELPADSPAWAAQAVAIGGAVLGNIVLVWKRSQLKQTAINATAQVNDSK